VPAAGPEAADAEVGDIEIAGAEAWGDAPCRPHPPAARSIAAASAVTVVGHLDVFIPGPLIARSSFDPTMLPESSGLPLPRLRLNKPRPPG
jgi:hypothetical protein